MIELHPPAKFRLNRSQYRKIVTNCRAATLALMLLLAMPVMAQEEAPPEQESAAPDPPVAALFTARQELQQHLLSVGDLETEAFKAASSEKSAALKTALQDLEKAVESKSIEDQPLNVLFDLRVNVRTELSDLESHAGELQRRATRRDQQLDDLDERIAAWQTLVDTAEKRGAPGLVMQSARETSANASAARASLQADRDVALVELSSIAQMQQAATHFQAVLQERLDALQHAAADAADAPLWSPEVWSLPSGMKGVTEAVSRFRASAMSYAATHGINTLLLFLLSTGFVFWLLKYTGSRVEDFLHRDDISQRAGAVYKRTYPAAALLGLLAVKWFGPPTTAAVDSIFGALLPLLAAALATTVFGKGLRLTIYTISAVLVIGALKPLYDYMPIVSRLLLLVQSAAVFLAIRIDRNNGRFKEAFPDVADSSIKWVIRLVFLGLIATVVCDIAGYLGLATKLRALVLGGLGLAIILTSIGYLITGISLGLLHVPPFSRLPVVRNRRFTIVQTIRKAVRWTLVLLGVLTLLQSATILNPLLAWLRQFLETRITIGAITLNLSAIAAGIGVLLVTWLINKFVRFVLGNKAMEGVNLATSVTYAVSKLLRYAIAVVGFLFAVASMGFDISKIMVVIGALGVGIGIGLQGVVNNFVSGLILLFEQPVKINDIANVDGVMGTVKQLGMRAAVIETFDGAEAIIPNADLISTAVTNWTKSNRRRRIEVDVGVAYGSDHKQVIELLIAAASADEAVQSDPESYAVFTGFGDSSLNFRLYAWLADPGQVVRAAGRIRGTILEEFASAGIEIPFPQRDVRVTMSGPVGEPPAQLESKPSPDSPAPA